MRQRCRNPKAPMYPHYGGRGITICERWDEFLPFLADMGPRPEGTSLGRIDNAVGYEPANCRWETITQQIRNRRVTKFVEFNGEKLTLVELAEQQGIPYRKLFKRVNAGHSIEDAVAAGNTHFSNDYKYRDVVKSYSQHKDSAVRTGINISERSKRVMAALRNGEKRSEIAAREGISGERVRQIKNNLLSGKWI